MPVKQEWPVMQLARNRKQFIEEVAEESVQRLLTLRPSLNALIEELELTRYREQLRSKSNPWKVDPEDEVPFWQELKSKLVVLDNERPEKKPQTSREILREIVDRYSNEIAGNFKPSYYRLARNIVTFGFSRLLNAAKIKRFGSFWSKQYTLQDKIEITG